jgi:putative membrane protein
MLRFFWRHILWHVLVNGVAFYLLDRIFLEFCFNASPICINVEPNKWIAYLIAGTLLGLVNITVKPILKIVALPFTIITLGLFSFVINAAALWIVKNLSVAFIPLSGAALQITGAWYTYLYLAVVLTVVNAVLHAILKIVK